MRGQAVRLLRDPLTIPCRVTCIAEENSSGGSMPKKAYLTIDDAPGRDFAVKMEFLYQHGIPAIFFCEGRYIQQRGAELCAAIERGFVIGNHSFDHPHFSDLSAKEARWQILLTDELIEQLYRQTRIERPAKYFRFPYFDSGGDASGAAYEEKWSKPASEWYTFEYADRRREIQEYLRELGYRQPKFEGVNLKYFNDRNMFADIDVRCTYDQAEYWLHNENAPRGLSTEAAILARIDEDFPYEGRALNCEDTVDILLVHDHDRTTELFFKIVERYLEKGIRFLPVPEAAE
jgi:peptidoglycan-N-acetylglucosamine deacetylase